MGLFGFGKKDDKKQQPQKKEPENKDKKKTDDQSEMDKKIEELNKSLTG